MALWILLFATAEALAEPESPSELGAATLDAATVGAVGACVECATSYGASSETATALVGLVLAGRWLWASVGRAAVGRVLSRRAGPLPEPPDIATHPSEGGRPTDAP